ncbi:MAG: hypothetical protein BGO10_06850 [Chlamydia sp. 32-24]|nr:MAG: hypothetical protein BGO10_06850 [Chlamydia sp. 32-24]
MKFSFILLAILFTMSGFADITISGNPPPLTISTAIAGSNPTPVTNATTTYTVTNLILSGARITGQLNVAMPTNVTLSLQLQAPSGGTSQGLVALSTTAQNLVTNIPIIALASNLTCTYRLAATAAALPATNLTVIITLTQL